jgi:hypothetical protein
MNNLFVSLIVANALRSIGFDQECLAYYHKSKEFHMSANPLRQSELQPHLLKGESADDYSMLPTNEQAIDWLERRHCIYLTVDIEETGQSNQGHSEDVAFAWKIVNYRSEPWQKTTQGLFSSREEAQEKGLIHAVEIIKQIHKTF